MTIAGSALSYRFADESVPSAPCYVSRAADPSESQRYGPAGQITAAPWEGLYLELVEVCPDEAPTHEASEHIGNCR